MLFVSNSLCLTRQRRDQQHHASEAVLTFHAIDALEKVQPAPVEPVQVRSASAWQQQSSRVARTPLQVPNDWTFTTTYTGTLSDRLRSSRWKIVPVSEGLPTSELQKRDIPVVFYTDLVLFEDELDDQGISRYSVKLRVMHHAFWYLLARFWLRVDNKLVRIYDTRYFHRFGTAWLVREVQRREASMDTVQNLVVSHWSASTMNEPLSAGGNWSIHPTPRAEQTMELSAAVEATARWRAAYHCIDEERIQAYLPVVEHYAEVLDIGI
jgi:type 2A phosphatase activator TIP41